MRRLQFLQHSFADSLGGGGFTSHLLAVEFRCSARDTGSSLRPCDPGQNRIELGSLTVVDEIQKSVLSPAPAHSFFIPRIRAKACVIMDLVATVIVRTPAAALIHDGMDRGTFSRPLMRLNQLAVGIIARPAPLVERSSVAAGSAGRRCAPTDRSKPCSVTMRTVD
jgi:hypothetical protein